MEVNVKVCNSQRIQIMDIQDCAIFLLIPDFRSRVYMAQKCLLRALSLRFQYQNRQQKRVFKLHQVEQSIRQLLILPLTLFHNGGN